MASTLLRSLEDVIRKLDPEAKAQIGDLRDELATVKADAERKLGQVTPILERLGSAVKTAVTDAAEQVAPGLRGDLQASVDAAARELAALLQL